MSTLKTKQTQIESAASHRRTPVVPAGHGAGKGEEGIGDPVLETSHAPKHALVFVERSGKSDEFQTALVGRLPWHGAAQHERRWVEALLGRAFHVGRRGGFVELFIGFD